LNGTLTPRTLINVNSTALATRKRHPAASKGVIVSNPILMTSHVDPQMLQTKKYDR
jgi:hypothetical protein